ncbi:MAG: DNA polymerase/3'-5' exonuclease PolX [Nanoarchaeota archaeon]|nr:DNA polymerase/3'-5' exonuclease PolX [Nanoarchaeota archaeon]
MTNLEIARILHQIAEILELKDIQFKPMAYQKAALSIESLSEDVRTIYQRGGIKELKKIPGVGESIAKKIEEYIKTNKIKGYEQLKKQLPINLEELSRVPGLGPKKIKLLYKKLKIKNIKQLKAAIQKHKLQKIPTLGATTEKNILEGIKFAKKSKRFLLGHIQPLAEELKRQLQSKPFIKKIEIAGSYRRKKETLGDLDILAISEHPKKTVEFFTKLPEIKRTIAKGPTKATIRLKNNLQVDLRVLKEKEFGSALQYFTGNKQHNIELRKIAIKKGYKLSEYGLFKKKKLIAGKTEQEIYQKLGMQYPEPEIRTNSGEIQAALKHKLPKLVNYKDVHADFQMHTQFSDGNNTIEEMAKTAKALGHKVIAITDHMGPLKITHALDQRKLKKYIRAIKQARKKVKGIKILIGAEVDLNKDGDLTATKPMLKELDFVLVGIHSAFRQSEQVMTKRILHAFENYPINALAHPTGRLINTRPGYRFNLEKVFQAAKDKGIFLEINAYPERLDLNGELVKIAKDIGCKFCIGTDSHNQDQLRFIQLGIAMARRGWLEKKDILNCQNTNRILKIIK